MGFERRGRPPDRSGERCRRTWSGRVPIQGQWFSQEDWVSPQGQSPHLITDFDLGLAGPQPHSAPPSPSAEV